MTDVGGGGGDDPRRNIYAKEIGGFCKNSAAAAFGTAACYLKYKSFSTMLRQRMVMGGPAVIFVTLYAALNYQGYRYGSGIVKDNAKRTFKNIKDHRESGRIVRPGISPKA